MLDTRSAVGIVIESKRLVASGARNVDRWSREKMTKWTKSRVRSWW